MNEITPDMRFKINKKALLNSTFLEDLKDPRKHMWSEFVSLNPDKPIFGQWLGVSLTITTPRGTKLSPRSKEDLYLMVDEIEKKMKYQIEQFVKTIELEEADPG